jgi:putative DNA primase/helicase
MNGEPQRLATQNDKPGDRAIFYVAHDDGISNGYAENNRTKEVVRWRARGQHLSREAQ